MVRLTSPAYRNVLPVSTNRFLSLKSRVLFCSSDRVAGKMMPFEIDLRTGAIRQIAETNGLDPGSLNLDASGRALYFLNEGALCELTVSGKREIRRPEVMAKDIRAFSMGAVRSEFFVLVGDKLQHRQGSEAKVLAEEADGPCLARPGGKGCLFTRAGATEEREFWYAPAASGSPEMLVKGRVSNPCWSADGEALLFLRDVPKNAVFVSELHEVKPEEGKERCLAKTSQFATYAPNENDSVFVGASASRAQPNVILLLGAAQRELTLCEHRSSNPGDVRPEFSPDSRRVYFQSDREGKMAIYSVNVETLVEPT